MWPMVRGDPAVYRYIGIGVLHYTISGDSTPALMSMLVAKENRLWRGTGAVHPRIETHITWLEKALKDLDKELRETL